MNPNSRQDWEKYWNQSLDRVVKHNKPSKFVEKVAYAKLIIGGILFVACLPLAIVWLGSVLIMVITEKLTKK